MENNKSLDLFGIAPYGEALKVSVEKGFEGISAFMKAVCMPALGEMGLMLGDKIRYCRL